MKTMPATQPVTFLSTLIRHLRALDHASGGTSRPAAILWTDPKAQWRSLTELLRASLPELLILGEYAPDERTGPAIWLRCLVDGALAEPALPPERIPILYLPGVARQDLRAGESCPEALQPLVELMFRGALWLQPNGSDWRVSAFLTSPRTLQLDVAGDAMTQEALLRALPEVAILPVTQLAGRRLEADDFDRLLSSDVVRDLLCWMGDSQGTRARLGANRWGAFRNRCRDELSFDPEVEFDLRAAELLAEQSGPWLDVWQRFRESPTSYFGIVELMRRNKPAELPFDREPWPYLNDLEEENVRKALASLVEEPHEDACRKVLELEEDHAPRRLWVWSRLGLSPMAAVLAPLARLARGVKRALGGTTLDEVARIYHEEGWPVDAAAWEALAMVSVSDEASVERVVRHLLHPWLEDSARAFQSVLERSPLPTPDTQGRIEAREEGCVLFADGLRYDLAQRLGERLEGRGCRVTWGHRWAAAPTVTATGKPAVTPVADAIRGRRLTEDFGVTLESGKPATAQNLRAAMKERGYQILEPGGFDAPLGSSALGWLEAGEIDALGHKLGVRLARQLEEELQRLTERILGLLDAGWESVRVVTDHGWLLLPGGLPKVDLPKHLTESRWARCAVIAGNATPEVPRHAWSWNESESFASAPGIACFNKSEEYAHGGMSVQECLTPDLWIERGGERARHASIDSITWRGLRCFVEAHGGGGGVRVDLRIDSPSGPSAVARSKPLADDGSASLVLAGDEHEEASLILVLLDEAGTVLAQKSTRVGVDS